MDNELMIKQLTWLSQDMRLGKVEKIVIVEGLPVVRYFAVNVAALEKLKLCAIPFHADHYSITFLDPQHLQATIDLRIEASQESHE